MRSDSWRPPSSASSTVDKRWTSSRTTRRSTTGWRAPSGSPRAHASCVTSPRRRRRTSKHSPRSSTPVRARPSRTPRPRRSGGSPAAPSCRPTSRSTGGRIPVRDPLGIVHRVRGVLEARLTTLDGIPVVRPELLMLQLCATVSPGRAERLLDRAWSMRLLSGASTQRVLDEMAGSGVRGVTVLRSCSLSEVPGTSRPRAGSRGVSPRCSGAPASTRWNVRSTSAIPTGAGASTSSTATTDWWRRSTASGTTRRSAIVRATPPGRPTWSGPGSRSSASRTSRSSTGRERWSNTFAGQGHLPGAELCAPPAAASRRQPPFWVPFRRPWPAKRHPKRGGSWCGVHTAPSVNVDADELPIEEHDAGPVLAAGDIVEMDSLGSRAGLRPQRVALLVGRHDDERLETVQVRRARVG